MEQGTTRRGSDTPVHRPEKPASSTYKTILSLFLYFFGILAGILGFYQVFHQNGCVVQEHPSRGWGMDSNLPVTNLQGGVMKSFRNRQQHWLHNAVNALHAMKLCTHKWLKWQILLHMLHHNFTNNMIYRHRIACFRWVTYMICE